MDMKLITKDGMSQITKENLNVSLKKLELILSKGTPVMFSNYFCADIDNRNRTQSYLFYSDGNVSLDGVFNIEKGKRNFSYLVVEEENPNSYQLIHYWQNELQNNKVSFPHVSKQNHYNENTFSRSGPSSWQTYEDRGTSQIIVGDILLEKFPEAINALNFAKDAVYFKLNSFYSNQNSLIRSNGDYKIKNQEGLRDAQTSQIALVRASLNLLNEARKTFNEYSSIQANQLGEYRDGSVQDFRKIGYPVNLEDYLIQEISHPHRNIALVKTNSVFQSGETYILPFKGMNRVVGLAFCEEMIKKNYPHGINE